MATLTTPGEWKPGVAAGTDYCSVGRHFIEDSARVWKFWISATVSSHTACAECAGEKEEAR